MSHASYLTRFFLLAFLACSTVIASARNDKKDDHKQTGNTSNTAGNPQNNNNGNSSHDQPEIPETRTQGNGPDRGSGHFDHGYGWGYGHHEQVPFDGGLTALAAVGIVYGVKRAREARKTANK